MDPLTCLKCQGRMKIISFIENEELPGGLLQELKTAPSGSDVAISAIYLLFPTTPKSYYMIFIYSIRMHDFHQ
jgi:hypothetical protein